MLICLVPAHSVSASSGELWTCIKSLNCIEYHTVVAQREGLGYVIGEETHFTEKKLRIFI